MDTLARMERVPTDDKDRPTTPVVVEGVEVFVDPYADMAAEEEAEEAAAKAKEDKEARERSEAMNPGKWWSNPAEEAAREDERRGVAAPKATGTGVGKFLTKRPAEGGRTATRPRRPPRSVPNPRVGTETSTRGETKRGQRRHSLVTVDFVVARM